MGFGGRHGFVNLKWPEPGRSLQYLLQYVTLPGSPEAWNPDTGPFNPHFVRDVGFGFLAAGGALAAFTWRRDLWPAALAGSAFLALHALLHLFEMAMGRSHHVGADLLLVVLPAALAVAVSWPTNGVPDA